MPLVKDQAIVLGKVSYSESDRIVKFFTLKEGKVAGIAKGGNKSQKRFMNTLEPFNILKIEYFEKPTGTLVRVENADIIESNYGIERNIKSFTIASFFVEFVDRLTKERQANPSVFRTLKEAIVRIKMEDFSLKMILFYKLKILQGLGYLPNFKSCVYCGADVKERVYFSKERGGILCFECAKFLPHRRYETHVIQSLIELCEGSENSHDARFEKAAMEMLESFTNFHLDIVFKSLKLLKELTHI